MKAIIEIDMDGDAFFASEGRELFSIVRKLSCLYDEVGRFSRRTSIVLTDTNGNTCGRFEIVD